MRKRKNKFDKYFLLTGKRIFWLMVAWFLAVILHNLVSAFFIGVLGIDFEEPVFFIIANMIIPLYFIVGAVYSIIWIVRSKNYPDKKFYIKLAVSIVSGLLITFILIRIGFLNDMYFIPITVFTLLTFGVISLFQKNKKK